MRTRPRSLLLRKFHDCLNRFILRIHAVQRVQRLPRLLICKVLVLASKLDNPSSNLSLVLAFFSCLHTSWHLPRRKVIEK